MAWETCPECGKKVYGYPGFLEHTAKHPGFRNKQALQLARDGLAFEEARLAEYREIVDALALPIGPHVRKMLEMRRESFVGTHWGGMEVGWLAFLHERIKRHKIDIVRLEAALAEEVKP